MGKLAADGAGTQPPSLRRAETLSSHFAIFQHWRSAELGIVLAWDGSSRLISLKEHDRGILYKQDRNSMGRYRESHSHLNQVSLSLSSCVCFLLSSSLYRSLEKCCLLLKKYWMEGRGSSQCNVYRIKQQAYLTD